jgi:Cysteine rich repeat
MTLQQALSGIVMLGASLMVVSISHAQAQPSPAQTEAIRSACRSDFMANCSGVQPGGKDALECLKRQLGKLSPACKTAVSAISGPPAPPVAAAPPAPKRVQPASAQPSTGANTEAAPPPPAVASLKVRRFILPERRVVIVAICSADAERLCAGVPPGGERILECLGANAGSLSPRCFEAIARVSER